MAGSTNITIEAGHVRRVLTFALWRIVSADIVGECELSEDFYDLAWRGIHRDYQLHGGVGEAEYRLVRIGAVSAAVRAVAAAADGDRLELPVAPEELSDALRDCMLAIDQNDEVLANLPTGERREVVGCRYTASRLLDWLAGQLEPGEPMPRSPGHSLTVPEFPGSPRIRRTRAPADRRISVPADRRTSVPSDRRAPAPAPAPADRRGAAVREPSHADLAVR
jgi:hypothetical protein